MIGQYLPETDESAIVANKTSKPAVLGSARTAPRTHQFRIRRGRSRLRLPGVGTAHAKAKTDPNSDEPASKASLSRGREMAGRHADAGLQCRRSDYSTPPQCRRRGCRCGGNVSAVLLNNSDPPRARRIPAGRHERPDGRVMILVQQLPTEAKREQPRGRLRTGATTSEQPQGARRQRRWRAYE